MATGARKGRGGGSDEEKLSTISLDFVPVSQLRRCSRPGCGKPAVATLTYAYADQTAIVGPLAAVEEPHSWDLCRTHASKITAPLGWEMLRVESIDHCVHADDEHLTALAEAVREAGRSPGLGIDEIDHEKSRCTTRREESRERAQKAELVTHPARNRSPRPQGAVGKRHLYIVPETES